MREISNFLQPKLARSSKKMHVPSWCASLALQGTISMRGPDNSFAAKFHLIWVNCFFLPMSMCPSLLWVCTPLLMPEWNHHWLHTTCVPARPHTACVPAQPHTACVPAQLPSRDSWSSCSDEKEQSTSWGSGLFPAPPLTKDCLCPLSKSTARTIQTRATETSWGVWLCLHPEQGILPSGCAEGSTVWLVFYVLLWSALQSRSPWPSTACFLPFQHYSTGCSITTCPPTY